MNLRETNARRQTAWVAPMQAAVIQWQGLEGLYHRTRGPVRQPRRQFRGDGNAPSRCFVGRRGWRRLLWLVALVLLTGLCKGVVAGDEEANCGLTSAIDLSAAIGNDLDEQQVRRLEGSIPDGECSLLDIVLACRKVAWI